MVCSIGMFAMTGREITDTLVTPGLARAGSSLAPKDPIGRTEVAIPNGVAMTGTAGPSVIPPHRYLVATRRPGVVIADDHTLLADTLGLLLAPEFAVLRCVTDGEALIAAARELRPDIALIDVNMPRMGGLEAGPVVRRLLPGCCLVYMAADPDPALAAEAFALGASGYLLKTCAAAELIDALRIVLAGDTYLSAEIARDDLAGFPVAGMDIARRLSSREHAVLRLAAGGIPMKEIGRELGISPRTVAFHKYRGMASLGLRRQSELVRFALENGMMAGRPNRG